MNDNKGQTIFLSVIGIATLLVAIIGATFAYFTTQMSGEAANTNVTTAKLGGVRYEAAGITGENVLPGWSDNDTITLTMDASDVDVKYTCYINVSALGDGDVLTDFYITSDSTPVGENTVADLLSTKRKFAASDKGQKVKIASGTLKGTGAQNVQTIGYTIGFDETNTDQYTQKGALFTAAVSCELESGTVYYNNANPGGTTTEPGTGA